MIDKYRLDDLRLESGEKGELARWVIQLQTDLDNERRRVATAPAPVVSEIDRQAICDKVYGKCSRIPGATFYNAAEFALDEVDAAMLQGKADGNSPVIPDCWVPCSERLPEETKDPDGGATGYLVLYAEGKEPNGGFNVGVWNVTYLRQWWRGFITHWQPLPAAPQQDGK